MPLETESTANKRIAKNTIFLYARMLFSLLVGLFTSRVVLNALGVLDYGIFNIVGGLVSMATFITIALTSSTQRFLTFSVGENDPKKINVVFNTSVTIHFVIAIFILILAETVGLWFLNTYLNIPESKMAAANWVYQFSIMTFMVDIVSVPYNAVIIANEHLKAFAYVGIIGTFLNLGPALILPLLKDNRLIAFGFLTFCIALLIRLMCRIYCKLHFPECHYQFIYDKPLSKEMFAFSAWSLLGASGSSLREQLSNVILNLFFGPTINAARGLAIKVSNEVSRFLTNFMMAINPQIMKQYSLGNLNRSRELVYSGSRYSFYLMSIISLPVMINLAYVLKLWLGNVPKYSYEFLYLLLISILADSFAQPFVTALQATGNIKKFQIWVSAIMLSEIPIAYVILKLGGAPYMAMYPTILVMVVALFARVIILKEQVPDYSIKYFTINIFLKSILLFAIAFAISQGIRMLLPVNFLMFIVTSLLACLIWGTIICAFGLNSVERNFVYSKVKKVLHLHG